MYQFFVEDSQVSEKSILITGSDVNHIKNVLRMKKGQKIRISDASGHGYFCNITDISQECVTSEIIEKDEFGTELSNRIYLFQGLPKGDKMELIIQKAVELGVYEIIPVAMKNCVVKLDDKKASKKIDRWQSIAESAAKQSKRTLIPDIDSVMSFKNALEWTNELDLRIVPYENERGMDATREIIGSIKAGQSVGIMIGPEGGFSDEEIQLVNNLQEENNSIHKISLGRRILRTETAGMATLSMLVYELDE